MRSWQPAPAYRQVTFLTALTYSRTAGLDSTKASAAVMLRARRQLRPARTAIDSGDPDAREIVRVSPRVSRQSSLSPRDQSAFFRRAELDTRENAPLYSRVPRSHAQPVDRAPCRRALHGADDLCGANRMINYTDRLTLLMRDIVARFHAVLHRSRRRPRLRPRGPLRCRRRVRDLSLPHAAAERSGLLLLARPDRPAV